jgi:hypothetical protein
MKKLLAWLIIGSALFLSCFAAFAQKTPAQFKTDIYNNIRTQPYGTTRAGDAFDAAVNASKSFYIDGTASGTNTYAVTVSNYAMTAYVTGQSLRIQFTNANSSGTITLNVTPSASAANPSPSALGAIAVKGNDGNNLAVGDIKPGGVYDLYYNGTHFRCTNVGGTGGGGPTGTITTRNRLPASYKVNDYALVPGDTSKMLIFIDNMDELSFGDFSSSPDGLQFAWHNDKTTSITIDPGANIYQGGLTIPDSTFGYIYYNADTFRVAVAGTTSGGGGSGDVTKVGTPANNQVGVWTGDGTIEGTSSLTYDGANFQLIGDIGSTGSRITKGWFTDLQVTNAIAGSITGNAATVTTNANLTGDVTSSGNATTLATVTVAKGGTGATTLTGLLQGNGTSAVTAITNSTTVGQTLRVTGSNTYAWGALDLADGDAITGALPIANGGTGGTTGAFLLGGNTLGADAVLGGSSGAFGVNIQTNGVTRHAISSTGTHIFTQSAQAASNDFVTFTQSAHTSGVARGLVWTAGAHTGSTASTEHTDITIDLGATLTKATGDYATNRSIRIIPRVISAGAASIITTAPTLEIGAPTTTGSAVITNAHSIRSTNGWITAQQTATSTQGFRLEQGSNVALWTYQGANVMRLTSVQAMNIGPTSTGVFTLSSARSIAYMADLNQVSIAHAFTSTNTSSTANKTMMDVAASWNTVPAGDNKLIHWNPSFVETGAVASNYYAADITGTLNFGATPTGNYYGVRIHPTITGGTLNSILGYGVIVDSPLLNNGFGTPTPTSTLQSGGSFAAAYVAKTGAYTLTVNDYTVEVTTGTHNQTLPTAVGIAGRVYHITNSGTGVVTVATTSSQTFVNVTATPTTLTLNQFETATVQSNGANWLRL